MTQIGNAYGQALYDLARDEALEDDILRQLQVLHTSIEQEPEFLHLLSAHSISKDERCKILEDSFRDKLHPYVLHFLMLLTQKGYIRSLPDCCKAYEALYNEDHGILPVQAVSAVPLTEAQQQRLTEKLEKMTGKAVQLVCRIDPDCIGGVRLDYAGKRVDGTVQNRLEAVRSLLKLRGVEP